MTDTWQRTPDTLWRTSAGQVVLLPAGAADALLVTAPGARLWALLADETDTPTLVRQLATDDDDPRRVAADLDALLSGLEQAGAVRRQP